MRQGEVTAMRIYTGNSMLAWSASENVNSTFSRSTVLNMCRYLVMFCFLGLAVSALGQLDRGSITGIVADSAANRIPSVDIVAANVATGVHYSTTSNETGNYDLQNLPLGSYSVVYRKDGFASYQREGVVIQVGEVARLDVVLEVGSVADTVTVIANADVLQTEDSTVSIDVNAKTFNDLPMSVGQSMGRKIDTFADLFAPTVSGVAAGVSVAGAQGYTKSILIDGTSVDAFEAGWVDESSPSPEAIEEFKVDTAGISAEAGRTGGGVFSFTMKSGTNSWHGSSAFFYTNEFLNANSWDNNWWIGNLRSGDPKADVSSYAKPYYRYSDYAFSGGGPIWKNKTFFYAAFERYKQADWQENPNTATVPTTAFLNGDFSALLNTSNALGVDSAGNTIYQGAIFDPSTWNVFPGNVIPPDRISPLAAKVVNIYRTSYQPVTNTILYNYPSLAQWWAPLLTQDQTSVKIDHLLTANHHLSGSIIYTLAGNDVQDTLWQNHNQSNAGPLDGGHAAVPSSPQIRLQDAYTIKPTMLNVLSLTWSQEKVSNKSMSQAAGGGVDPVQLGFPSGTPIFPNIYFGGANGYTETTTGMGWTTNGFVGYNYSFDETLTWTKGRHIAKFGGELRDERMDNHNGTTELSYNFASATGVPESLGQVVASQTGFGFANFLLGDVDNASSSLSNSLHSRRWVYSLFAEDNIKVTQKLTIDAGLRWDADGRLHELDGNWGTFGPNAVNPAFNGLKGAIQFVNGAGGTFETKENYLQFGPHLGAAYRIGKRLVVRGSFGMYYAPLEPNGYYPVPYGYNGGQTGINQIVSPQNHTVAFNWDQNGYPGVYQAPTKNLGSYIPWSPVIIDPDTLTLGRTENWNIGGQYEIARDVRLEVGYIGNIGRKLHDGTLNPVALTPWTTYSQYLANGANLGAYVWDAASASQAGVPYPYSGWGGPAYQAITPFPQTQSAGGAFVAGSPIGQTSYNTLLTEVISKGRGGFTFDFNYTLQSGRGNTRSAFVSSPEAIIIGSRIPSFITVTQNTRILQSTS